MKKNGPFIRPPRFCGGFKVLLIMKMTAFLILITALQVSAKTYSQQKVTVDFNQVKLADALKEVEKKSSYRFVFSNLLLPENVKVSYDAKDQSVEKVLNKILENTGLTYSIMDNNLIVIKALNSYYATIKVSGVVTNAKGEPIANVSVTAGNGMGVLTAENGAYTINVSDNATLTFTIVGYTSQEIKVDKRTEIDVTMQEASADLSEVVIVGYGKDTKKKIVSSVSSIKTDKIASLPYTNMSDALAGRAPGVITQASGGEPGVGFARIAIRGGSGPDAAPPLYVIDNVVSSQYDFQNLQPQDIDDISILKDGAATAVYGSRASNGIILVTTKRGQKGKVSLNFGTLYELSSPIVLPKRINSYNYAVAQNQAATADGRTDMPYSPGILDTLLHHKDPVNWPDNDWYDLALRKYTPQVKYSLDMSGGSDRTTYFLSLAAFNQGSNYKTDVTTFRRYNARAAITQKFDKQGITVGANLYGTFTNNQFPAASAFAIWSHLQNSSPMKQAYNPDGTYAAGVDHPLVDIDPSSGYSKTDIRNVNANLNLDWALPWVKGLTVSGLGYVKSEDAFYKTWTARAPQYDNLGILQPTPLPTLSQEASRFTSYTLQAKINYQKSFGLHSINALALYEQTENRFDDLSAFRKDYVSSAVDQLFAGSTIGLVNNGYAEEGGRAGVVGRLKYDYASRYIIEGSFRYDGSDNFPPGSRWGFFPSVAAGWVVSEEKFFSQLINKNALNSLKLRYSYATVGSDAGIARFPYLSNYNLTQNAYVVGGNLVNGFSEGSLVDPNAVTWYQTQDYNTGVDFGMLKGHLNGSVEYFYRRTTNFLTSPASRYTTPLGTALPVIRSNSAFRRAGWEFQLGYNNKVGDFTYSINGNMTFYNELWETNANEDSVTLKNPASRTTHETNYWGTGYINEGYYNSVDAIINNPRRSSANQLVPGDLRYQDINGDGKIDGSDFVRMGSSAFPHLTYGVNINVGYKAFSLEMLWQGTGQRSVYLGGTLMAPYAGQIVYDYQRNFWTPDNTNAPYPRQTLVNGANNNNNYTTSDFWLYNAKYLRLKSLRIAFDVRRQFPKQLSFLNSCLLTLNGTNLLTFSPVKSFFDPETSDQSNYGYPTQKVYSVGLTVGF